MYTLYNTIALYYLFIYLHILSGPAFIPYLDALPLMVREDEGPFRMPIADKYKVSHIVYIYMYMYMYI